MLIAVGLVVGLNYWRGTGKETMKRKRHAVKREDEKDASDAYYCPQCGKRAQPADQFCRTCGTRLRRDE